MCPEEKKKPENVTQLLLLTGAIYSHCSHLANRAFIKSSS